MQISKKIYFSDYKCSSANKTGITIAFSESEYNLYNNIKHLSSATLRDMINIQSYERLETIANEKNVGKSTFIKDILAKKFVNQKNEKSFMRLQSTFSGGKGSPMHDWYPYLEGYSPEFVKCLISRFAPKAKTILDPFCGSGTTAIVSVLEGLNNYYCEVNPLCQYIIETKLIALTLSEEEKTKLVNELYSISNEITNVLKPSATETDLEKSFKSVFGNTKFFEDHIFKDILSYQCYISSIEDENLKRLLTIAGIRSLIPSSLLVRRGDLRFKTQKELEKGNQGFRFHVQKSLELIASDLLDITEGSGLATFLCDDAKEISGNNLIDAVITSPPYLNGTNYFRNTKIELWFIGKLKTKSDLRHYRDLAITSGINDVTKGKSLSSNNSIISEIPLLSECIKELSIKEYDSRISMMVENYFWDMFKFLSKLPKLLTKDATICIDLGDSVYCNVYIPTQDILKEMMSKLGFEENERVILRERKSRNGTKLVQTVQVFK